MPRKYTIRSKEEKLSDVKRNLSGESACSLAKELGCDDWQIRNWVKLYQVAGEAGLEVKKKPGNPLSRYERRKELTCGEQLLIKRLDVSIHFISPFVPHYSLRW